jgi:pilus assembly protein CpaD
MTRYMLLVCLGAALAGCDTLHDMNKPSAELPRTPTTRYAATATHMPDEILLAPHATGLSAAQAAAVAELADRWRDSGAGPVTIQAPAGDAAATYRSSTAVQAALLQLGVAEDQIRLVSYQPAASPTGISPIVVGFTRYEAHGPQCGREWKEYTKTFLNQSNSNFGCAVTANTAAMVANPADLAGPRRMDPTDANRRETILDKYRKGELMSSTKDPQANGAVSTLLQ